MRRIEVRIGDETLKRWRVLAACEGLSLPQWIAKRCNEAVEDCHDAIKAAGLTWSAQQ